MREPRRPAATLERGVGFDTPSFTFVGWLPHQEIEVEVNEKTKAAYIKVLRKEVLRYQNEAKMHKEDACEAYEALASCLWLLSSLNPVDSETKANINERVNLILKLLGAPSRNDAIAKS